MSPAGMMGGGTGPARFEGEFGSGSAGEAVRARLAGGGADIAFGKECMSETCPMHNVAMQ